MTVGTADENVVAQTPEQIAANLAGRVANPDAAALAAAAAKQKAAASQVDPEQAKIDAENDAKTLVKKDTQQTPEEKAAAEQAAKDKAEKNDDGSWKVQFIDAGSPEGNAAIKIMETAGVSPVEANSIFEKAIKSGNLEDVNWAVLEARLSPEQFVLARAGINAHYENTYKAQMETRDYGFKAVGGAANWDKLKDWAQAKEATDPTFKRDVDSVRKAISIGGRAAQYAIDGLKAMYDADPKNSTLALTKLERGDTLPTNKSVGEPLSRRDFYNERRKLGDRATADQVQALMARRELGIQRGQ